MVVGAGVHTSWFMGSTHIRSVYGRISYLEKDQVAVFKAFKYAGKRGALCLLGGTPTLLATTDLPATTVVVEMIVVSVLITIGIWLNTNKGCEVGLK